MEHRKVIAAAWCGTPGCCWASPCACLGNPWHAFNQWYGTQSHPHKCPVTRQAVCCWQAVLLTGLLACHLLAPTAATSSHTHQLFVVLACTGGSTVAGLGAAFRWLCKTVLCIAARVWCMCGPAAGTSSLCLLALLDRCASCFRTDACC